MGGAVLASELFARIHSTECRGRYLCHYCGAPCDNLWPHGEPPPVPFVRAVPTAKRPGDPWMCKGCWLYRRTSVTAVYLDGGMKDRQCLLDHSWLLTAADARTLRGPDAAADLRRAQTEAIFDFLRKPPLLFCLSLVEGGAKNLIQTAIVNDLAKIDAGTELKFTLNGVPHAYTVHELEVAIDERETAGREPGVRELLRVLGRPLREPRIRDKGRPAPREQPKKMVAASGMPQV